MAEYDTTNFVNIDDEDFVGYFNRSKEPNGYTVKAGESRQMVKFMAETFAKHLIDKVLQKKGVKDTLRDTPLRRSLLAQILPQITAENPEVKKLSVEEELKAIKEQLEKEKQEREALGEKVKPLLSEKKKAGRPKKEVPQPAVA